MDSKIKNRVKHYIKKNTYLHTYHSCFKNTEPFVTAFLFSKHSTAISIFETRTNRLRTYATTGSLLPIRVRYQRRLKANDGSSLRNMQAIAVVNHEGWRRRHRLRFESDDAVATTSNIDRSLQLRRRRFVVGMATARTSEGRTCGFEREYCCFFARWRLPPSGQDAGN